MAGGPCPMGKGSLHRALHWLLCRKRGVTASIDRMSPPKGRSLPLRPRGGTSAPGQRFRGGRKRAPSRRAQLAILLSLAVLGSLLLATQAQSQGPGRTFLASVSSDEAQANRHSLQPSITAEGQWVAFATDASNLVPDDSNGVEDVFVRDIEAGNTVRVSLDTKGEQGNGDSNSPSISADGRFVAFVSEATNFIPGCSEFCGGPYVYVRDRDKDGNGIFDESGGVATVMVSVNDDGRFSAANDQPDISADGRFVAFVSNSDDLDPAKVSDNDDVFVRDRDTDIDGIYDEPGLVDTQLVSRATGAGGAPGNGDSVDPTVSANGELVAFSSTATNLGSDSNGVRDIYLRDRAASSTTRVSITTTEGQANGASVQPSMDAAGRFVAFATEATNMLPTPDANGTAWDVFIRDRVDGTTELASVSSNGVQGNGRSLDPDITADGRYIAFVSSASNLRRGDTNRAQDVYVRDQLVVKQNGVEGRTNRVSISSEGDETAPRTVTEEPVVSDSGQFVAFVSNATNLIGQDTDGDGICDTGCDTNRFADVFVRDRQPAVDIDPIPVIFDTRIVTTISAEQLVSVANEGDGPVTIDTVDVIGPVNPGDFLISTNGCNGERLHPEEECFVGIRFRPTAAGTRTAFFAVARENSPTPDTALLMGGGFQPIVVANPDIGPPGFVTRVEGSLFPPSSTIVLTWKPGLGRFEVQSDAAGNIEDQMLIFHRDISGPRLLRARGLGVLAEAEFMVTAASVQPPKFISRS
jgi:Tol biopolymer transport system component